ncbi:MAG TPA: CUAEP/CCAEP-tail radical SAM protein [Terriglobales bacterium]|nr:CUAEP/CCAEP-tail radical SAM protein [Terriglobales bacterium]
MRVVLISTYEMGRQPFGLASPAAWLGREGFEVIAADVSRAPLEAATLREAGLVGLFLPMHTATRLALRMLPGLRRAAPGAHFCAYGLYAEINRDLLRAAGVETVLGGEFEAGLTGLAQALRGGLAPPASATGLPRLVWQVPARGGLPPLERYARLQLGGGESRIVGYTEASRGCKHRCRHCPIVPVYGGQFRVVAAEVVLADIRQQVEAGAEHITFGDPDFFNGPAHALRLVEGLHREFPELSYDVTIKVEHLLRQRALLPRLRATGCALITTAVESFDDAVLARLEKGHSAADIFEVLELARGAGLALNPTLVAFTPWTTVESFGAMCRAIAEQGLEETVAPVQYGIRLLIPRGSRLLELEEAAGWLGEFDPEGLSYRWRAAAPEVEELCASVQAAVAGGSKERRGRVEIFNEVAGLVGGVHMPGGAPPRATVPYLDEPWFC